ncbi:MAG TPA: HEPN/Toprim-associated domain-containing protein [Bryobacteraceae bacterium]
MSSSACITIGGYPIETSRNDFHPWFFKKSERQIVSRKKSERNRLVWGAPSPDDADELETCYLYVSTARILRRRLQLAGCTKATLEKEFRDGVNRWLDALKKYNDGEVRAHVHALEDASLPVWLDKLGQVMKRGLVFNRWNWADYKDDVLNIMLNYDPRLDEVDGAWPSSTLNFPCTSGDGFGRAFLEIVPDDAPCLLDVTDLVAGGWTKAFDDLDEYIRPFTTCYDTFEAALNEIRSIMRLSPDNPSLLRLVYANVITSMEVYSLTLWQRTY